MNAHIRQFCVFLDLDPEPADFLDRLSGRIAGKQPRHPTRHQQLALAHDGFAGLRPDEVPAILQKGERVLSRRETAGYGAGGPVSITIQTRDAESFRQSRTQVASDIARAVSLGRRGM